MKKRTQIILAAAVLVGIVALSGAKRGDRSGGGKCSSGACCPMLPGLPVWSTNTCAENVTTNGAAAVESNETVTNPAP